MAEPIQVINVVDALEEAHINRTAFSMSELIEILRDVPVSLYQHGPLGKGGRLLIEPGGTAAAVGAVREAHAARAKRRPAKLSGEMHEVIREVKVRDKEYEDEVLRLSAEVDELIGKLRALEELQQEESGRIDQLHKAVEEIQRVYTKLRTEVDPKANLPEPPALPAKYKYKVLIVGGDNRIRQYIEPLFPTIRIIHKESGGASNRQSSVTTTKDTMPIVDAVFIMTKWIGHSDIGVIMHHYGPTKGSGGPSRPGTPTYKIHGAGSSLETALILWLMERQKEEASRA